VTKRAIPVRERAQGMIGRLAEAGRVLSAANEDKIREAIASLQAVLAAVDGADATAATEARRIAEAWSPAAWDACDGAYVLAGLLGLMGDESDEPDQLAMLRSAVESVIAWIQAEAGEIGQPPEGDEMAGDMMGFEARARAAVADVVAEARRRIAAAPARRALTGDVLALREAAVATDGAARVKVIAPGWGSSAYYPAQVLERDGPKVFPAGTQMFWDHPTDTEEAERPEGSLRDLAAVTTSPATWNAAGPEGPGLYADVDVFEAYRESVNELAPHIGVSIRAWATATEGTVEGRTGPVIESLTEGTSIDYVTRPGAGGQVLQLFEAARRRPTPKEDDVDPTQLEEARTRLAEAEQARTAAEQRAARAEEALLRRAAGDIIAARLTEARVPEATAKRLSERLAANPPVADGKLDEAALKRAVDEAAKEEADYLASLGVGQVRGFGGKPAGDPDHAAQLQEAFGRLGLGESAAKTAAAGRV
jgi:hypothetical protein